MTDATYADEPLADDVLVEGAFTGGAGGGLGRIQKALVRQAADEHISEADLATIGANVVDDWNRDKASNKDWREKAEKALDAAAQETVETKNYPFNGAANVKYPLLTIASMAFSSRAAPAIIKGDEAIKVKTFGKANKAAKQKRADRMADYLNWLLFYKVQGWEQDTDAMLVRLPAAGQHYRKVWWDPLEKRPCIESVSALRLTLAEGATSLQSSPRVTHDYDRYPHQLQKLMASGYFRNVELTPETTNDDDQAPRVILEQYRYMDLDEDGLDEPYIVTVDASTAQVLRMDEAWEDDGIERTPRLDEADEPMLDEAGEPVYDVVSIDRWLPFVDYGFIPDPKGRAYSIGFGHLLTPIMDVVNTNINLMIDAGHAQVAGGGFISQEVRLQGAGQNGSLRFQPSEYKTVNASGADLRAAIVERTFPAPSPVLFQLLGLLMEAAEKVASINDAITGDASRNAPVGTTLALIEQGQQVFNAIYKRIYRALREEFKLFADCVAKYGDPEEYARFCDVEPEQMGHNGGPPMGPEMTLGQGEGAPPPMMGGQPPQPGMLGGMPPQAPQPIDPAQLFREDFNSEDLDIRPISDPSAVTKMQLVAKFQFAATFLGKGVYKDDNEVIRYGLETAGIDQAEDWIPQRTGPSPQEEVMAKLQQALAEAQLAIQQATAAKLAAEAQATAAKAQSTVQLQGAQAAEIADGLNGQAALERAQAAASDLANDEVQRRKDLADVAMTFMGPALQRETQGEGEQ